MQLLATISKYVVEFFCQKLGNYKLAYLSNVRPKQGRRIIEGLCLRHWSAKLVEIVITHSCSSDRTSNLPKQLDVHRKGLQISQNSSLFKHQI